MHKGAYSLKKTNEFSECLTENVHLSMNSKIISFDTEPLVTNIPFNEAIHVIGYALIGLDSQLKPFISENCLLELLNLATKYMYVLFNKTSHDRGDGISMGAHRVAILTEVFMTHLDEMPLSESFEVDSSKLLAGHRCVSDTFTISKSDVNEVENSLLNAEWLRHRGLQKENNHKVNDKIE